MLPQTHAAFSFNTRCRSLLPPITDLGYAVSNGEPILTMQPQLTVLREWGSDLRGSRGGNGYYRRRRNLQVMGLWRGRGIASRNALGGIRLISVCAGSIGREERGK